MILTMMLMDVRDQLGNEMTVDWWLPGSVEAEGESGDMASSKLPKVPLAHTGVTAEGLGLLRA